MRKLTLFVSLAISLATFGTPAMAADLGTAEEARAMLVKAVTAIKAKKEEALIKISKGLDGFKDRDLYPFCGGPDGNFTAHPSLTGRSMLNLNDKSGKAIGQEMYKQAKEGTICEVVYKWPRPGTSEAVTKVSYVTRVDDQVCAVGYYK